MMYDYTMGRYKGVFVAGIVLLCCSAQMVKAVWRVDREGKLKYDDEHVLGIMNEMRFDEGSAGNSGISKGTTGVNLVPMGGQILIQTKLGNGETEDVGIDDDVRIEPKLEKSEVRIASAGGSMLKVKRDKVEAVTDLELGVDFEDNTLIVKSKTGTVKLETLPDEAVKAAMQTGKFSQVASGAGEIKLGQVNGEIVYEISGVSQQKLLGIWDMSLTRKMVVYASNGETQLVDEGWTDKILDFISF